MTTSRFAFLSEILGGKTIPVRKLAYFRERFRNRVHEAIFLEFLRQQREHGLTQRKLAERIQKAPEQVNRCLAAPGNWTIDTICDLLTGLGCELDVTVARMADKAAGGNATESYRPVVNLPTAQQSRFGVRLSSGAA